MKTAEWVAKNTWETTLEYGIADVRPVSSNIGVSGYIAKKVQDYEESRFSNERYRAVEFSHAFNRLFK